MGSSSQQKLLDFEPQHEFFVGIDSDGCVFDGQDHATPPAAFVPLLMPIGKTCGTATHDVPSGAYS